MRVIPFYLRHAILLLDHGAQSLFGSPIPGEDTTGSYCHQATRRMAPAPIRLTCFMPIENIAAREERNKENKGDLKNREKSWM